MPSARPQEAVTPTKLSLLRVIREAEEDHGGLLREERADDEVEVGFRLVACFRVTGRGVDEPAHGGS
jgi:hypothetical protein